MSLALLPPEFVPQTAPIGPHALVDDRGCEPLVGGNKARKLLGGLFTEARARGARRLLTVGARGSHHVLATAVLGARAGFEVHAVLWPQPPTDHSEHVFDAGRRAGLVAHHVQSAREVPALLSELAWLVRRDTFFIPLGGSTPSSLRAHAEAASKLAVGSPELRALDAVVLPVGSGGTAAGVALGLAEAFGDGGPRVHGVLVSAPYLATPALTFDKLSRAAMHGFVSRRLAACAWRKLRFDNRFVPPGYGHASARVVEAIGQARDLGLELEPTYTGKAFASCLELERAGDRTAFWLTLGRIP